MMSGKPQSSLSFRGARGLAVMLAAAGVLFFSLVAAAQEPQAPPHAGRPAQQAAQQPISPASQPGMFESIGRWFQDSFDRFKSGVLGAGDTLGNLGDRAGGAAKGAADAAKGVASDAASVAKDTASIAKDAAKSAADAAKEVTRDAADAVARLPTARIVEARERCVLAPNGAPDCRAAADAVCRSKGFKFGSSLDIQSAEKCPARLWLSGRSPEPGECETESFVTRAVCQ